MWCNSCGLNKIIGIRQPGPTLDLHRKLATSQLGSQAAIIKFARLQEVATSKLLANLLDSSGTDLEEAIKRQVLGDLIRDPSSSRNIARPSDSRALKLKTV